MPADGAPGYTLRRARTSDVGPIRNLVAPLAEQRVLIAKEAVAYYEGIQEFLVAQDATGTVIGCGALHVMWEDLAEVRTLATSSDWRGRGVGHALLDALLQRGREIGVARVFCLTFEVDFFTRHGFTVMANQDSIDPVIYSELLRSHDEGVAEFLDLARVKPNTLGNTRMIRRIDTA
ncbi:N-acetylglutamate synthase [Tersicoccus solisilvae]|uniref:N-acetylglutamate synthase n=1 Tax=Tersicoccus solisilvae TaxID=1882339 RepID=A0ABQ1P9E5_9MICC|nr:amino-acid N-acetyltransferase [Tersicoccus solisilvae]GGC93711.1 N-acetylglutamate synthase [Tersicoccus solisilvae]